MLVAETGLVIMMRFPGMDLLGGLRKYHRSYSCGKRVRANRGVFSTLRCRSTQQSRTEGPENARLESCVDGKSIYKKNSGTQYRLQELLQTSHPPSHPEEIAAYDGLSRPERDIGKRLARVAAACVVLSAAGVSSTVVLRTQRKAR